MRGAVRGAGRERRRGRRLPECGAARVRRLLSAVAPPERQPRGAAVRDAESRRREREAARGERIADGAEEAARDERGRPRSGASAWSRSTRTASVCMRCPLSETRTRVVFGAGNADADLMFVGEAPGAEEDRQGLPFVGRAGGLLNEMLGEIGMSRDDVFIANVFKCRPPGNRDPTTAGDRVLPPLPARAGAADRAARRLHAGQLRHQAADRQPDRDHQGAGHAAGARARRAHRVRDAAVSSRGGAADPGRGRDPAV